MNAQPTMIPEELIGYASRTGTRRNLDGLRRAGWRLLVSAKVCLRSEGFRYCLDNGAWTAYSQGQPFDERAFCLALDKMGPGADWTVLPDIVAGGLASLDMSLRWMRRVLDASPRAMIAVQDGMQPNDVRPFLGDRVGLFVGGSTDWKIGTMQDWGALSRESGCWLHIARVNSARRIHMCSGAGAHSFDGTSASRFSVTLPRLDKARRQMDLFSGKEKEDAC